MPGAVGPTETESLEITGCERIGQKEGMLGYSPAPPVQSAPAPAPETLISQARGLWGQTVDPDIRHPVTSWG